MINSISERETTWFGKIDHLYQAFNRSLGISQPADSNVIINYAYHPAVERAHIDVISGSVENKTETLLQFRTELRRNIETTIAERLKARDTTDNLSIINGQLYSKRFPSEPFKDVLERGKRFRHEHHSQDQERESAEVEGWNAIEFLMTDPKTPSGTRIISLSPPSPNINSPYRESYIDEFILQENANTRQVLRRRTQVDLDEAGYIKYAQQINPEFFVGFSGQSDAWFLGHPIRTDFSIPENSATGTPTLRFVEIIQRSSTLIDNHIDAIFQEVVNWNQVANSWNRLLRSVDRSNPEEQRLLITQIKSVSGGCGLTEAFGKNLSLINSVAQFGAGESEYKIGKCSHCGADNVKVGTCGYCQSCE